ncbi:MAG: CoA pyrophosphatase [Chloroflexi bacterium]|nr:CoA pyrophosphatase [Chloroflexota bacterium]
MANIRRLKKWYNHRVVKQQIEKILRNRQKKIIIDAKRRASAVLIPLFYSQGQYHVLFTERSEEVNFHKGQVCFPGGTREPSDSSLLQTALREAEEEIGLKAKDVEVLGEFDDNVTFTSDYVISPFVALIPYPYPLKADGREIKEIFSIPLSFLMDEANFERDSGAYKYEGHVIWGATARILKQFMELLKSESGALR